MGDRTTATPLPQWEGDVPPSGGNHIVTGGAGFIGSHLVDALVDIHHSVTVVDDFSRGKMDNLYGSMKTGQVRLQPRNLEHTGYPCKPTDVVWHLAAKVAGIEYNRRNQYEMLRANLAINQSMIDSVRICKPRLFVYISTACVYPGDAPVPTPESAGDICNPEPTNHGYGIAKWVGEQMVRHLYREHNVPCVIVRLFNVFGPRDHYEPNASHVAPALIRRVMEGENPLKVWGSGNQTRTLVDVRDIARALVRLAYCQAAWDAGPINIGHRQEIRISDLVQSIVTLSGKDIAYQFDTSKPDGHARRAPDTTRLRDLLGWIPDTPMETTLRDMFADYEARFGGGRG